MSPLAMSQLTEADQQLLLQIARNAVRAYLSGHPPRSMDPPTGALAEGPGVFVSIHQQEKLRGCIGNLYPASPLYRSTAECAIAAAVGDPRFMPLTAEELPEVEFEISVLSPMHRVHDVSEIEIGKHGLLITKGNTRGLLLPQVASQHRWDRERFLQETCKKAGLRPDDWKQDAIIQSFSALVFDERKFHANATT
jgi:AmmeMemoRadiSam system protein A